MRTQRKRGFEQEPLLRICADDREVASGLPAILEARDDVSLRMLRLSCGDYRVEDRVLIERKTVRDFVASMIDGRLFRQALQMSRLAFPLRPAILVEGRGREIADMKISRETLLGAMASITLVFDIPVVRTGCVEESAKFLIYSAKQLNRFPWTMRSRSYGKPKQATAQRLHILQSLPGVGLKTARTLLAHFGTVENCLTARAAELCKVPGIGRKTAALLRRVLAEDPDE